jgi:hypothetical protein
MSKSCGLSFGDPLASYRFGATERRDLSDINSNFVGRQCGYMSILVYS